MEWQAQLVLQAKKLLLTGGELRFIIEKRDEYRMPLILIYPENKIKCDTEIVPIED